MGNFGFEIVNYQEGSSIAFDTILYATADDVSRMSIFPHPVIEFTNIHPIGHPRELSLTAEGSRVHSVGQSVLKFLQTVTLFFRSEVEMVLPVFYHSGP